MRGANVVRRRSGTNPGETAGATGAVNGGQADGGSPGLLAGGAAAGDGSGLPASVGQNAGPHLNPSSPQWTSPASGGGDVYADGSPVLLPPESGGAPAQAGSQPGAPDDPPPAG